MIVATKFQRLLSGAACVLALSACATTPPAPVVPKTAPLAEQMTLASQAATVGQNEKAMGMWKQASKDYPADKSPWVQMAQTKYAAGQYGEAIINAQEILVRDPSDKLGNSIIAISGLRLSTRALSDLSRQNNLSGNLRTESQDLAKLLRESLGETVLVPVKAAPTRVWGKKAVSPKPAAESESSANPFDGLK